MRTSGSYGYSRDHRPDCVQVVIALVVTPEGFPLAYEVLAGNTADNTTLKDFLARIERQYGKARRVWLMDRGIPTEEVLTEMRKSDPPVQYLVGIPKGRLTASSAPSSEALGAGAPRRRVKLLAQEQRALRVRREPRPDRQGAQHAPATTEMACGRGSRSSPRCQLTRDALLDEARPAQNKSPAAWRLVDRRDRPEAGRVRLWLNRKKLREVRRREGRYLLRTNLTEADPAKLWEFYLQLVPVEEAFKNLKGDLSIRPIYHQEQGASRRTSSSPSSPTACTSPSAIA